MPTTTVLGHELAVDAEGFMTNPSQWTEEIGTELAKQIGIEMTEAHWAPIRFLRTDYGTRKATATLRQVSVGANIPIKELFALFPAKPAKKMAYVAGLPKPAGCV